MEVTQAFSAYRQQAYQLFALLTMKTMDESLFSWVISEEACCTFKSLSQDHENTFANEGFALMAQAVESLQSLTPQEQKTTLETLATDRTYLFRALAPGVGALPPYESYWAATSDAESVILALKKNYRHEGLQMSNATHERPDYLGIELAYMAALLEKTENTQSKEAQKDFIQNHISTWIPKYVASAKTHAVTDFYKGFLIALESFVAQEKELVAA